MPCPFAEIVKATAPAVAPKVGDIVNDFYPRMFKNNPEAKAFFNPANQFADPPLQRMALANAVVAYASNIDQLENLGGAVTTIAHKHCGLGVKPEHYTIVHKNLMESIGHILGDVVTPEIGTGWSDAVLALAKILYETEEGLYKMAADRSGGWVGVKDFKVSNIRHVTKDCAEFTFKPIDGKGSIDFTPGQFLTLHLKCEGATPRHYTVTNAPGKDYLQCCTKKIPGGFISGALHKLVVGDLVGLAAPFGVFKMGNKPAVLISAGIGATPMKTFLESSPGKVKFVVHVDKNEAAHPFREEMVKSGAKTYFHYTEKSGRPTPEALVKESLGPYLADHDFFLCGPGSFLNGMKSALEAAGAESVNLDVFGPTLAGPVSKPASTPGMVDMKVTTKKSVGFYVRAAKAFMAGTGDKEVGEKKAPVCVLNISGLGEAINAAVAAATALENEGLGTIKKVETSYPEQTGGGSSRGCARISITIYNAK